MYTFDTQIVSDLHKEAFGFRPTSAFYDEWSNSNDDEKQSTWDWLLNAARRRADEDAAREAEDVAEFERELAEIQKVGRDCSKEQALRWMTPVEPFEHSQDIEQWVWERGILFTDIGRWAVAELKKDL